MSISVVFLFVAVRSFTIPCSCGARRHRVWRLLREDLVSLIGAVDVPTRNLFKQGSRRGRGNTGEAMASKRGGFYNQCDASESQMKHMSVRHWHSLLDRSNKSYASVPNTIQRLILGFLILRRRTKGQSKRSYFRYGLNLYPHQRHRLLEVAHC